MKINRNNYELYILDYIEGTLSLDMREDFDCFLNENPDIREEILDFEEISLEPVLVNFPSKNSLKIDEKTSIAGLTKFEQLSIASLENDVNQQEIDDLNLIKSNSVHKQMEFEIFQKIKLIPDYSIKYNFKNQSKHKNIFISNAYYISAIAASIALFIGILIHYLSANPKNIGQAIAYNTHIKNYIPKTIQDEILIYNTSHSDNSKIKQEQAKESEVDSFTVNYLQSKQLASVDIGKPIELKIEIKNNVNSQEFAINIDDGKYLTFKDFLNKKFKENILKQPATEKVTFVSVGKAISHGLSRILKKDIKFEEKLMDDGSKLYAFKTGSFEIYTSSKSPKKNEDEQNEKDSKNLNLLKE